MRITGGIVSYEDGVKSVEGDQYSPTRKVRVELNFGCEADEEVSDAEILSVLNKAQGFVQDKLGIKGPTPRAKKTVEKVPGSSEPAPGPSVAETQEANIAKAAASSKNAAKAVAQTDKEKLAEAAGLTGKDPAAIEDETPTAEVEDALADLGGDETAAAPVTDADLNAAVKARNAEIKAPVKIRELAAGYNGGPGHTLAEIPAEKRHEFLAKLKALKA